MQENRVEKMNAYARRLLPVSAESFNEARSLRARYIAGLIAVLRKNVVHDVPAQQPLYRKGNNAAAKI